jgi:hypothetical protein
LCGGAAAREAVRLCALEVFEPGMGVEGGDYGLVVVNLHVGGIF